MRHTRKDATKVWHNPEINSHPRGSAPSQAAQSDSSSKKHRAALEALFAPRAEPDAGEGASRGSARGEATGSTAGGGNGRGARDAASKGTGRIVLSSPPNPDAGAAERQRLLGRLLVAEGRPKISKAADELVKAGFAFPNDQDVHLQLLEHSDEDKVVSSIEALSQLLVGELPKRRTVLEARLRRLEEFAEEPTTREAARRLRRQVSGRPATPSAPGTVQ